MLPFFINKNNLSFIFDSEKFAEAGTFCEECNEPTEDLSDGKCPWRSLTEDDKYAAASQNHMLILAAAGLLEDYYKGMSEITKKDKSSST